LFTPLYSTVIEAIEMIMISWNAEISAFIIVSNLNKGSNSYAQCLIKAVVESRNSYNNKLPKNGKVLLVKKHSDSKAVTYLETKLVIQQIVIIR
jgi:hypothetical protein